MKIMLLTAQHPRNFYICRILRDTGMLAAVVVQPRDSHIPAVPEGLGSELRGLYIEHFEKRRQAELKFFGAESTYEELCDNVLYIKSSKELASEPFKSLVGSVSPDLLISYNASIIPKSVLDCFRGYKWNIHAGLTPWYRGASTHFWANYMLQPQMTGVTLHELTFFVDGGDVIHQSAATLVKGDGLHDVSCRAIYEFGKELGPLLEFTASRGHVFTQPQTTIGKTWLRNDWSPFHLKYIYQTWKDDIVDAYKAGVISGPEPKCFRRNWSFL